MARSIPLQHWGATAEEIAAPMPGDDLIDSTAAEGTVAERSIAEGTRSITIDADPDTVFDFISQMGFGRAGWYSYDLLDNLGRRSAESINPAWCVSKDGELVPGGPIDFVAAIVDRPHAYVLQVPTKQVLGHGLDFTLSYVLTPIPSRSSTGEQSTRVVTRVRIAIDGKAGSPLEQALLLGDGVMVRKQLLGLKPRAEAIRER